MDSHDAGTTTSSLAGGPRRFERLYDRTSPRFWMDRINVARNGLADATKRLEQAKQDVRTQQDNLTYAQSKLDAILDERRKRNGG